MCSEEDLKSIGLPLGPRKKILKFVAEREAKSAAACKVEQEPALPVTSSADTGMTQPADLSRQLSWLMETTSNTQVGYVSGLQGVGFPLVTYPQLEFKVNKFFALGSPIAMFLTIRGVESLSRDFHLPTCESMLNIFHPFDPVAYRMEPLINPSIKQKPVLIPHHKGRKRLHLELKENIVKVGSDIKDKVLKSLKSTWASINDFARAHTSGMAANQIADSEQELSDQVDKVLESVVSDDEKVDTSHSELESVSSFADNEVEVGQLNQGRRIDFVLQEAPFESFNDYLFALSSHLVYWESEDVSLMLMKEVYALMGVFPDVKDKTKQQQIHSLTEVAAKLNSSFSNQPLVTGASYPSQPPMTGVSYPSQPPMTGASYPSQPPMTGASYPSQPPMTGASYPSQPPMAVLATPVNHL
ncbi:hypothetical protein EB796_016615 [Bugula neritina]|uniref:DDHD domain-containing protein n=1 Tax=Bugula neritina TaxID=10212 RepID=A0A7J7JHJ6_BUGNE|nr:hypothetical protein EB796_016615 [Bugula neritina]